MRNDSLASKSENARARTPGTPSFSALWATDAAGVAIADVLRERSCAVHSPRSSSTRRKSAGGDPRPSLFQTIAPRVFRGKERLPYSAALAECPPSPDEKPIGLGIS
jgi:hypothetical protein